MNTKLFIILIIAPILFFIASPNVFAQSDLVSLTFELSAIQASYGSETEMRLLVSAREPVNAFDIVLNYPSKNLELVRASTANSIVSIWQSLPSADDKSGVLRLVGGMTQPFSGESGEIIMLVFRAVAPGEAVFTAQRADFALADGRGTFVSATVVNRENKLAVRLKSEAPLSSQIVEAAIVQDPLAKTPIVISRTSDDGAVREMRLRSREWFGWSEWQKTRLPAAISKSTWAVQLAVIGWEGGESRETIYRYDVAALKFLFLLAAVALLLYAGRRVFGVWKIKK